MKRVLIIEDDAAIGRMLNKHLSRAGHAVMVCATGEAALAVLADLKHPLPSVVICDLGLPGISGVAVVEGIRAAERTEHIAIVVLSGRTSTHDHALALEAGADLFLEKPMKLSALDDALATLQETT